MALQRSPGSGAHARESGYRDALKAADIPYDRHLVVTGDFLEQRGYQATQELLALETRPTAIFTSADTAAFGAIKAIRDARLKVPRDVSVVGFDDIPEASLIMPALTTVRQPLLEMGAKLIERESTARPPRTSR